MVLDGTFHKTWEIIFWAEQTADGAQKVFFNVYKLFMSIVINIIVLFFRTVAFHGETV